MKQLFISYDTGSDSGSANRVAYYLKRRDLDVWIAPSSIRPGEEWLDAIGRGLETSSHFALVSTPNAYLSKWVRKEYNAALLLEAENEIEVIPLEVEKAKMPIFLRGFQRISFINKFEAGLHQLASVMGVADEDDAASQSSVEETEPQRGGSATETKDLESPTRWLSPLERSTIQPPPRVNINYPIGDDARRKAPRVFMAYDIRDRDYAQLVSKQLETHGIRKWMAPDSIEPGARWGVAIVDAIVDSTDIIVIMTPNSAASQAVQQELLVAEREGIRILPILLAGEPFKALRQYQFFDARNLELPSERFIEKLKR